jgi:alpha-amylase
MATIAALVLLSLSGCQQPGARDSTTSPGINAGPIVVTPQRDWSDAIIYFVLLDRFADGDTANNQHVQRDNPGGWHGGDIDGLIDQLDEIADLGATAIWINPIQTQISSPMFASGPPETGTQNGFEHWGFHGYWMDDFKAVDPHFGDEADLARLVDEAHARGIKVLLDVVYNHAGYGARYEVDPRFTGWIRKKPVDCAADPITCQVGGLPDFVTEDPQVRTYLFDANIGLAERTGLDGFRLDTVKHIDHPFWQSHREETRNRAGEDFFLLAEVWGGDARVLDDYFENDEMDAGFDFSFRGNCRGFVDGKGRTIAYAAYLEKRHRVRDGYHLAHYLSSHDEPMFYYELGFDEEKFRLCVGLQMTSLGIPVIYYGEEVGRDGSVWPTNRNDMPWADRPVRPGKGIKRNEGLRDYYKKLISIRRAHPALSGGDYARLSWDGDLLVFQRTEGATGDAVIVAVNRGDADATATVPAPAGWPAIVREALTDQSVPIAGGMLEAGAPAMSIRIFVPRSGD